MKLTGRTRWAFQDGRTEVRHSAVESKVISFPTERSSARRARLEEPFTEGPDTRMPFGLCLAIWAALAVAGWGALDAAARLI